MTETQERFLREVAARLPTDRVAEVHLFPALRQGAVESGVAVVAVEPPADAAPAVGAPSETRATIDATAPAPPESPHEAPDGRVEPRAPRGDGPAGRLTIYSASYRLTIKGADRGRWETSVAAEADAPLVTLEAVVRGVRHRAGDDADTERLSGDEFRAALAGPPGSGAWIARA